MQVNNSLTTQYPGYNNRSSLFTFLLKQMTSNLLSSGTIIKLYEYLQNNGGSYNDLRVLFQHCNITPSKDVQHSSTRNRDCFIDEYIQPLNLSEPNDVHKLIEFIEQVTGVSDSQAISDAEQLIANLKKDGWHIDDNKIVYFGADSPDKPRESVTMPRKIEELLPVLINGLPRAMYPLKNRRKDATCLQFDNEYDVQDLLHALLRPWIKDIRPEEYTPSYVGSSTRIDFVLTAYKSVLEVKYIRDKNHAKKVGNELLIDIAHYRAHPDCEALWIVIYDPNSLILNPSGLITDLNKQSESIKVKTYILN